MTTTTTSMTTKELLEKTYECKTLEELYALINGHPYVRVAPLYRWGDGSREPLIQKLEKNNTVIPDLNITSEASIRRLTLPATLPKIKEITYSTYYKYDRATQQTISREDWVRLPRNLGKFLYFGEKQEIYVTSIEIHPAAEPVVKGEYDYDRYYSKYATTIKMDPWKKIDKITDSADELTCLQSIQDLLSWYQAKNPYGYKWLTEDYLIRPTKEEVSTNLPWRKRNYAPDIPFIITHDEVELLDKMVVSGHKGPAILDYICGTSASTSDRQLYHRMFKTGGKKPQEIFALSMDAVKVLWNKPSIQYWDSTRKLLKLRNCSIDDIVRCDEYGYDAETYRKIDEILRAKDAEGNPIFSFTGLINYLRRIDVNEAISLYEGMILIKDTIAMARQVNQLTSNLFDTDSLKRTHDVIMRNASIVRNEKIAQGVALACNNKYNYQLGEYFVRQIKTYDDLINEGEQQQNCLRYCYANPIANKTCLIYVMRRVDDPDRSLISIELDPTGTRVRQQLMRFNNPINSEKQLAFLAKWAEYREKVNAKENNI